MGLPIPPGNDNDKVPEAFSPFGDPIAQSEIIADDSMDPLSGGLAGKTILPLSDDMGL